MICWLQTRRDLLRNNRWLRAQVSALDFELEAVRRDLAMWQELSRCPNQQQHVRLAHELHLAHAELQVWRGEDPHQASAGPTHDEGWVGLLLVIAVAIVLACAVAVGLAIAERIDDRATTVRATHEVLRPVAVEETTTSTSTTTTTAAPTTTTTTGPEVKAAAVTGVAVHTGDIADAIREGFARFGPAVAEQAVDVADCESLGLNPHATGDAGERGLFQIHPKYHQDRIRRLGFTWDQMYEVGPNIAVAVDLYAEQGWSPWTCAP